MGRYIDSLLGEEDEKKKKPSQTAREMVQPRAKKSYIDLLLEETEKPPVVTKIEPPTPTPAPVREPEKKKGLFTRVKEGIGRFFRKEEEEPAIPEPTVETEEQYVRVVGHAQELLVDVKKQINQYEREIRAIQAEQPLPIRIYEKLIDYPIEAGFVTLVEGKTEGESEVLKRQEAIRRLRVAEKLYSEYLGLEEVERGFFKGLFSGKPAEIIPFSKRMDQLNENLIATEAKEKLERGEKLTPLEKATYAKHQSLAVNEVIDRGLGYKVGQVVRDIPSYALAFAMTNPDYMIGKEVTLNAVSTSSMPQVAQSLLGWAVGSLSRTVGTQGVGHLPMIASQTVEYATLKPELVASENGDQIIETLGGQDEFDKAFKKAFLMTYVENATEMAGAVLDKPLAFMQKAILGKFASRLTIESSETFLKIAKQIGWNGIIAEVFEEELAELAQAPIEERVYYMPFLTPQGRERLLVETLGIAAFGGVGKLVDVEIQSMKKIQKARGQKAIDIPSQEGIPTREHLTPGALLVESELKKGKEIKEIMKEHPKLTIDDVQRGGQMARGVGLLSDMDSALTAGNFKLAQKLYKQMEKDKKTYGGYLKGYKKSIDKGLKGELPPKIAPVGVTPPIAISKISPKEKGEGIRVLTPAEQIKGLSKFYLDFFESVYYGSIPSEFRPLGMTKEETSRYKELSDTMQSIRESAETPEEGERLVQEFIQGGYKQDPENFVVKRLAGKTSFFETYFRLNPEWFVNRAKTVKTKTGEKISEETVTEELTSMVEEAREVGSAEELDITPQREAVLTEFYKSQAGLIEDIWDTDFRSAMIEDFYRFATREGTKPLGRAGERIAEPIKREVPEVIKREVKKPERVEIKKEVIIPESLAEEIRKFKSAEEFVGHVKKLDKIFIQDEIRQANLRARRRPTAPQPKSSPEATRAWNELRELDFRLVNRMLPHEGFNIGRATGLYSQAIKVKVKPSKIVPRPVEVIIPESLKFLVKEARKYKSAREFVKSRIGEMAITGPRAQREWVEEMEKLTDIYNKAIKEVKPVEKPVKKPIIEPKVFKPKKIKKPKEVLFRAKAKKQLQQEVKEVIAKGKTQEESVTNIDKYLQDKFNQADDPLYVRKLKAIRAELKRQMYETVGATTGNWKKDYAYFHQSRNNPEISQLVDRLEEGLFEIDEVVNLNPPVTMGLASTGSEPIGKFEERIVPKKGTHAFKLFEKSKELIRKYAQSIGEGYLPRRIPGRYYVETRNIRVNALNDLSAVVHEITHFLDFVFKISDKLLAVKGFATNGNPIYDSKTMKYRRAITDLYVKYYANGKKTHKLRKRTLEGFATLLQKYVESPQKITAEYPLLVNNFLLEGGEFYHSVMKEIISDLNKIVEGYQGLNSLDKVGARVVTNDMRVDKPSFLGFSDKIRTFLADEIYPIEVLAKKAERVFTVKDPSLWLRAYNNVSGIINNNISSDRGYWTLIGNDFKKIYDFNWKTLIDLASERNSTEEFGFYLVARREHFSYKELDVLKDKFLEATKVLEETPKQERSWTDAEGKTVVDYAKEAMMNYKELKSILDRDGFTRVEVDEAYLENKDRFIEEEKMFDVLTRADLKFLNNENVQLVDNKKLERLSSKQGYASFKRQFYDEIVGDYNEIPIQTKVGKTTISSFLRRKGSQKTIINPLYSGISNHSEIMRKGLKQLVYNKVTDIGISAMFPNLFQELQLQVSVDKKTGAFFYPQEKDPNIIMGRAEYKRKPVLIDGELKSVVDNILTYENIDVFIRLYTGLSRQFTAGTTGYYPPFAVSNIVRDQITAVANTTNKYKPLLSSLRPFKEMLRKKDSKAYEFYTEYMVMGGERQTFTGWQKLPPDKLFERISSEKKGLKKAISLMEKGTDILSIPAKYSELVTRATEYINAREAGKPQIVALEEAGRITAPFHHIGTWGGKYGQIFIRGLPFFNASLQVLDQHLRTLETTKGRQRMAFVLMAITAAYLTAMMGMLGADDDQKEQYKDLKSEELAGYLYFPHPSGKKLIRIPISDVFSPLGTIINMIIADKMMKARYKPKHYMTAATAMIPDQFDLTEPIKAFLSWIPQVFKAGVETVIGVKTWPEVSPLESMGLKNLPPGMRTVRNTSVFAKWLGEKIDISPIKIDYLITGYLGRATGIALGKPGAWDFRSTVIRDYWFSYGRRVNGTYDLREENNQKYNAYQKGLKDFTDKEVQEIYRIKILTNDFAEIMGDFRKVDIKGDQEKAAKLRNEALNIIGKIETGDRPKGYLKWVKKAKDRRKKNLKKKD